MATGTLILPINAAGLPSSNPPGVEVFSDGSRALLFDAATDETCVWRFRMPENYSSALTAKIQYTMDTATANEVIVAIEVMAITDGDSAAVETDSYDTANTSAATTVPGTAGHLDEISLTLTNADSVAAGDWVKIRFRRDADNVGDDATGDMKLWNLSLEWTTT